MNAIAKAEQHLPENVVPASSMLEVISRAAADPATDVAKLERLMAMAERIEARNAEQAFAESMTQAQAEMGRVSADAHNPSTKSKYASYAALDRAVRPIYAKHGFALSFGTGEGAQTDCVRVICTVSHRAGHSRLYHVDMPADGKGAKGGDVMTKTHAVGAALSYGSRYLLKLIFNVAVGEDDDDGNGALDGNENIGAEELDWIKDMIERSHSDLEKFCTIVMKVESLADIKKRDMPRAREALNEALNYWQRKQVKTKEKAQ